MKTFALLFAFCLFSLTLGTAAFAQSSESEAAAAPDSVKLEAPVCEDSLLFGRKLLHSVKPVFETVRDGAFELEISVRPDGSVASVEIVAEDAPEPQVEAAVRDAVLQWRFTPLDVAFDQRIVMTYAYAYDP